MFVRRSTPRGKVPTSSAPYIFPPDRLFAWNPGLMSKGGPSGAGIPNRTTVFTTLSPIGGGADDAAQINTAIGNCPLNQVVALNAGAWSVNGGGVILLNKAITLRGAGAGKTIITKTDGSQPQVLFTASITGTVMNVTGTTPTISFTGSIVGSVLTVTGPPSGTIKPGIVIAGAGLPAGLKIASYGTGYGAAGTYNLSASLGTITSEAMTGTQPLFVGMLVTGTNVPGSITVSSLGTGTGLTGTYNLSATSTVVFNASIAGSVMTLNSVTSGTFATGLLISGAGVPGGITIVSLASGTLGAAGSTYNLSASAGTIGSETMNGDVPSEAMIGGQATGPHPAPIIAVGPAAVGNWFGNPDLSTNSTALTADAPAGSVSITVANASIFTGGVGQIVLLDELSGAQWMPDNVPGNLTDGYKIWAAADYRVSYKCHWPTIPFVDDFKGSNFTGSISGSLLTVSVGDGNIVAPSALVSPQVVNYPGAPANLTISSFGTGTGGPGTYNLSASVGTVSSQAMTSINLAYQTNTFGDEFTRLDRMTSEVKEIKSIVGNTITFTSPLAISYRVSHTAQLTWYSNSGSNLLVPHTQMAGVEDLSLFGGDNGNIAFTGAAYCWAKGFESAQWAGQGITFIESFRCEARHFYSHDATYPRPTSGAYAICLDKGSSEILCEDYISVMTNKVMVARASGAGCVFGYGYTDMGMIDYNQSWIEIGVNGSHLNGSHHILFEGLYGQNADSDNTHGASIYHTFFRNWLRGRRHSFLDPNTGATVDDASQSGNGPRRCAAGQSYSYWMSFVGNVMGGSGEQSGWVYETIYAGPNPGIWMLGWDTDHNNSSSSDPVMKQNVIRDGNWDWLNSQQSWHNSGPGFTLPNSLYLTTKPAFFGANTWPWVDPSTGATSTLPAKLRWELGNPNGP